MATETSSAEKMIFIKNVTRFPDGVLLTLFVCLEPFVRMLSSKVLGYVGSLADDGVSPTKTDVTNQ